MSKLLSALVAILLSLPGNINAAEPAVLVDAQMDEVTAGATMMQLARISAGLEDIRKAQKLISEARQQAGRVARNKLIQARRHILEAQARLKPVQRLPDAYSAVELYQDVKINYYSTRMKLQTVAKIGSSRVKVLISAGSGITGSPSG